MEDEEIASALKSLFKDSGNKEDNNWLPDSSSLEIQITDVHSVVDSDEVFDRNFNNIKITDVSSLGTERESEMKSLRAPCIGPRLTETLPDSQYHMPIITEGFPEDLETSSSSSLITSTTEPVSVSGSPSGSPPGQRKSVILSTASLSVSVGGDTGDLSLQVSSTDTAPVKRGRGRPKGSRNKRKRGLPLPCVSCSSLREKSR